MKAGRTRLRPSLATIAAWSSFWALVALGLLLIVYAGQGWR